MEHERTPNHLEGQTSPYLLQHLHNPVDWYPWGEEALRRARVEGMPIFLSIGYSACHWCHVMERESFEDAEVAELLNRHFVSIKVDREERPDLDEIYMTAVQIMTGTGGWPLSVFLTPWLKPFFGGTYFPPEDRHGLPGFRSLLKRIAELYTSEPDRIKAMAEAVTARVEAVHRAPAGDDEPPAESGDTARDAASESGTGAAFESGFGVATPDAASAAGAILSAATNALKKQYDPAHGGFGGRPKFPNPAAVRLLLRLHERSGDPSLLEMASTTLDRMAAGGIYDLLGGGFHRYSVDEAWLVPHFEKMLYDQAMLVPAYIEAAQVTGEERYARVARETLDYVLREMTSPDGAFYSTQDADSEGEEGRFFVWTPAEVRDLLGRELGDLFCRVYDVTPQGNFEGRSILHPVADVETLAAVTGSPPEGTAAALADARRRLFIEREKRVRPHRDDKVITAWNGLMIAAMAMAARVLDSEKYGLAAQRAGLFMLETMRGESGLLRVFAAGRAHQEAFLEDYAALLAALIELYQYDFDSAWLEAGQDLAEQMIALFGDKSGGFYDAPAGSRDLVVRPRSVHDGSIPSGNSLAADALLRLGRLTGRDDLEARGEEALRALHTKMERAPLGMGMMLLSQDLLAGPRQEVVVVGPRLADVSAGTPDDNTAQEMLRVCRELFLPRALVLVTTGDAEAPAEKPGVSGSLLEGKTMVDGRPAAYVCTGFSCSAPVTNAGELLELLKRG